jgi:type 1 glutamine amidotransferase
MPYIELRVDKIVAALERWALPIPFVREIAFGHVLFHELGHHIHNTIRPEYSEKEDVPDTWAGRLNANFVRETYWYGAPLLKIYMFMRRRQWI